MDITPMVDEDFGDLLLAEIAGQMQGCHNLRAFRAEVCALPNKELCRLVVVVDYDYMKRQLKPLGSKVTDRSPSTFQDDPTEARIPVASGSC
jgi:hypothetical protein